MPKTLSTKILNILHAEDNPEVFESCRNSILHTFEREMLPQPNIEHVSYGNRVFEKIYSMNNRNKVYDVMLLDIELLDKAEYNGLIEIVEIKDLTPSTKIFVLSGKIYENLYYDKLKEYKENGLIEGFFETGNHQKWCSRLVSLVKALNVGILHFSDMHMHRGDHSQQILSGFANSFDKKADLLVLSGDIADKGKTEEFEQAKSLLIPFCNTLNIRHNVCVPGNHDILRNTTARRAFSNFLYFRKCMDEYGEYYDGDSDYQDVQNYADYLNFVRVFPSLRTIVWGLNSATCIEDQRFGYKYGEITSEQLRQAEEKLKEMKKKYPNYLIIAVFHHNIFEPPYYFDRYNTEDAANWIPPVKNQGLVLKKCMENDVNLLLSGHSHVSSAFSLISHNYKNTKPLHVLSAGIFSEKGIAPQEPQLAVNYLSYQIDLSGNITNMYCQPYSLKLTDGYWKKREGYPLVLSYTTDSEQI